MGTCGISAMILADTLKRFGTSDAVGEWDSKFTIILADPGQN